MFLFPSVRKWPRSFIFHLVYIKCGNSKKWKCTQCTTLDLWKDIQVGLRKFCQEITIRHYRSVRRTLRIPRFRDVISMASRAPLELFCLLDIKGVLHEKFSGYTYYQWKDLKVFLVLQSPIFYCWCGDYLKKIVWGLLLSFLLRTLQRQFRLYIPFLGIARPQSQFPHSCVCEQFIYSQDRSTNFLQQKRQTNRGNI